MKRGLTIAWLLLLASVPLWLDNLYVLHVLIITGIFIIAAMSLNLLLGYTGQLSLGHVAFFGIGAYTSSLTALGFSVHLLPDWQVTVDPKPVWLGMLLGTLAAGLCGWAIGRISFKVRGAYFVIVTVSFAEVVRLVALNWVELTQGPMALNNIPYLQARHPRLVRAVLPEQAGQLLAGAGGRRRLLHRHPPPGALARRPRHDRAAGRTSRWRPPSASTSPATWCWQPSSRPPWPAPPARSMPTTCASSIPTCSCSSTR